MTKNTDSNIIPPDSSSSSTTNRTAVTGISGAVIILIVLFAQFVMGIDVLEIEDKPDDQQEAAPVISSVEHPVGVAGDWFDLYFTQPINTSNEAYFYGAPIEQALVTALDDARQSIDVAVFQMNSQPVTAALIRAQDRGVEVRVVTDGEFGLEDPASTIEQLEFAGIEVVSDGARRGLMHNKFFVIDQVYVWTGSTNITHNGIYNNNNNAMLIRSSKLAKNYTTEFEELFSGQFGVRSPDTTPNQVITLDGTRIETIFEAEGNAPAQLIALLNEASSVRFMAFSFTREDMFAPILTRVAAGELDLQGIIEASSRRYVDDLYCAGINVREDGNPNILHHKVFIFDASIVVMGSFNFSGNAADSNDENMLIIYNQDIAQAYLEEFAWRWAEAEEIPPGTFGC